MSKIKRAVAIYVDDSAESQEALSLLRKEGYHDTPVLNVKDPSLGNDFRDVKPPFLFSSIGEYSGLEDIKEFIEMVE